MFNIGQCFFDVMYLNCRSSSKESRLLSHLSFAVSHFVRCDSFFLVGIFLIRLCDTWIQSETYKMLCKYGCVALFFVPYSLSRSLRTRRIQTCRRLTTARIYSSHVERERAKKMVYMEIICMNCTRKSTHQNPLKINWFLNISWQQRPRR